MRDWLAELSKGKMMNFHVRFITRRRPGNSRQIMAIIIGVEWFNMHYKMAFLYACSCSHAGSLSLGVVSCEIKAHNLISFSLIHFISFHTSFARSLAPAVGPSSA